LRLNLVTGDHPRHRYLVKSLVLAGFEIQWISQRRGPLIPETPSYLTGQLSKLHKKHFESRAESELSTFNMSFEDQEDYGVKDLLQIDFGDLNSDRTSKRLVDWGAECTITFGCEFISSQLLDLLGHSENWNIHGGLSPWYRGNTTMFWPHYLLEPQFVGVTLHKLDSKIDGGEVILQTSPELDVSHGVNLHAAVAVKDFVDKLVSRIDQSGDFIANASTKIPKTTGRIWTQAMWNPHHLIPVYETFEDRVIEHWINNSKDSRVPDLFDGFIR
jgi:hypothetical protein